MYCIAMTGVANESRHWYDGITIHVWIDLSDELIVVLVDSTFVFFVLPLLFFVDLLFCFSLADFCFEYLREPGGAR